ncbi:PspC domain-containing protein [Candidatus Parcubacteria bacterium]|nr:PspC domain-containing protein [Candidatus Parcubacteria bacterium]
MSEKIKKLYRSRSNRMLFGVCGGLGSFFKLDPNIFRIIFIFLAFMGGSGLFIYLVLVLLIPGEGGKRIEDDGLKEINEFKKRAEEKIQDVVRKIKKK